MKHLEPSVRILKQEPGIVGAKKMMELAGRICYASTPKECSYEKFFEDTLARGHGRVLEFGTLFLLVPNYNVNRSKTLEFLKHNNWTRCVFANGNAYITTNFRVVMQGFSETWEKAIESNYAESIMSDIEPYIIPEPLEHHKLRVPIEWEVILRGIADEFRTHTMHSSLMESQRYCLYTLNKFDGELKFGISEWYRNQTDEAAKAAYIAELEDKEKKYTYFVKEFGMKAEQARFVLGANCATRFIQCAFVDNWEDFFSQRATYRAHEDARYIANKALAAWKEAGLPELHINYNRK